MPSRTSFFDKTIYRQTVRRFWPLWAAYAVFWAAVLPLWLFGAQTRMEPLALTQDILSYGCGVSPFAAFIASVLAAMAAFSWLYQAKSTAFFAALPVRREALFLSSFAAGLSMLLAGNVLVFLLSLLVSLGGGMALAAPLAQWLALTSLDCIAFYGFASFCAMLTGSLGILPALCLVLQFAVVAAENLVDYLRSCIVFGATTGSSLLAWLSPLWYRIRVPFVETLTEYDALHDSYETIGYLMRRWDVLLIYAAVGVVLSVLALLLCRRRRMEAAGDLVAINVLKPIFRWCMGLGCALCAAAAGYSILFAGYAAGDMPHALVMLALLLVGGLAGWFGADMLIYKSFRIFRRHGRGALLLSALLALCLLGGELDLFGTEKKVPEAAQVERVYVETQGARLTLSEPESIAAALSLHKSIIEQKAVHEANDGAYRSVRIEYYQVSARFTAGEKCILTRSYRLSTAQEQCESGDSDLRQLEALCNLPESIAGRKALNVPAREENITYAQVSRQWSDDSAAWEKYGATGEAACVDTYADTYADTVENEPLALTAAEAWELYTQCILPDLAEGTLGRIWLVEDDSFARTVLNCRIDIDFAVRGERGYTSDYFYTVPTTASRRTNAWLEAHGVELETCWDYLTRIGRAEEATKWPYDGIY